MQLKGIIHKVKPTYGFILVENVKQVFFHISQWLSKDAPQEFDEVEFDLVPSHKAQFKECANNVRKISTLPSGVENLLAGQSRPTEEK